MNVPIAARLVCRILQNRGFEANLVGGCVRDSCMGREPKDWDIATSAMPHDVINIFERTIPTGIKHGTVTVVVPNLSRENGPPTHIEVTTYRSDGDYGDCRRPDSVVLGVSLLDDLSRRDFTMNAMAYDPISGEFHDPFGGRDHIRSRQVVAVGHPEDRFNEDALRILRAIRFASVLGFSFEFDLAMAISRCSGLLRNISGERIWDEMKKILVTDSPVGLDALIYSGPLRAIFLDGISWYPDKDLAAKLKNLPVQPIVRLARIFRYTEFFNERITDRLKLSVPERRRYEGIQHVSMILHGGTERPVLRKLVGQYDYDTVRNACMVSELDDLLGPLLEIHLNNDPVRLSDLAINGNDLIHLGYAPGKVMGDVLHMMLDEVSIEPSRNTREFLTERAKDYREILAG